MYMYVYIYIYSVVPYGPVWGSGQQAIQCLRCLRASFPARRPEASERALLRDLSGPPVRGPPRL